jgi:hypothetical protein
MRSAFKLFLVLVTVIVILFAWITHQLNNPGIRTLCAVLVAATLATFFIFNFMDYRDEKRKRRKRESQPGSERGAEAGKIERSGGSFALREKKSGLTWGGGNIKASEATRGTKRKFLGK